MNYFRLGSSLAIFHPETLALAKDSSQRPILSPATSPGWMVDPIHFYRTFPTMLWYNLSQFTCSSVVFFLIYTYTANYLLMFFFIWGTAETHDGTPQRDCSHTRFFAVYVFKLVRLFIKSNKSIKSPNKQAYKWQQAFCSVFKSGSPNYHIKECCTPTMHIAAGVYSNTHWSPSWGISAHAKSGRSGRKRFFLASLW